MKNRKFALLNPQEALTAMVKDIEADPEYDDGEMVVHLTHVYHHLNTAWNARDETEARTTECKAEDFDRWQQFPDNIEFASGA